MCAVGFITFIFFSLSRRMTEKKIKIKIVLHLVVGTQQYYLPPSRFITPAVPARAPAPSCFARGSSRPHADGRPRSRCARRPAETLHFRHRRRTTPVTRSTIRHDGHHRRDRRHSRHHQRDVVAVAALVCVEPVGGRIDSARSPTIPESFSRRLRAFLVVVIASLYSSSSSGTPSDGRRDDRRHHSIYPLLDSSWLRQTNLGPSPGGWRPSRSPRAFCCCPRPPQPRSVDNETAPLPAT